MKIINTAQYLLEAFLVMPSALADWKRPKSINGEQLKIKFSWIAKVWIDMTGALKEGRRLVGCYIRNGAMIDGQPLKDTKLGKLKGQLTMKLAYNEYHRFMKKFKETGEIDSIPSYVYFV